MARTPPNGSREAVMPCPSYVRISVQTLERLAHRLASAQPLVSRIDGGHLAGQVEKLADALPTWTLAHQGGQPS